MLVNDSEWYEGAFDGTGDMGFNWPSLWCDADGICLGCLPGKSDTGIPDAVPVGSA